jgi:hypothetical protein
MPFFRKILLISLCFTFIFRRLKAWPIMSLVTKPPTLLSWTIHLFMRHWYFDLSLYTRRQGTAFGFITQLLWRFRLWCCNSENFIERLFCRCTRKIGCRTLKCVCSFALLCHRKSIRRIIGEESRTKLDWLVCVIIICIIIRKLFSIKHDALFLAASVFWNFYNLVVLFDWRHSDERLSIL